MEGLPAVEPVELRDLVARCVDKSYENFRGLAHGLGGVAKAEERREQALKHLADTRSLFEKLLVLTRWSVQSPLAAQCAELLKTAKLFTDQLNESNDRLFFLHADLNRAKERTYDLATAIDVLYGGTYPRLPKLISYAMHPKEMPDVDEDKAIQEMDDIIRFRLIEEEIPSTFTRIDVEGGFVIAHVEGEFEIVFTLNGKESDSLWRLVAINTVLTDAAATEKYKTLASTNTLRIIKANAPTELHYMHMRNLVQKCMNKSSAPFVAACDIMRDFCCSLSLQILVAQGHLLTDSRWKSSNVEFVYHADKQVLDICYWSSFCRPAVLTTEAAQLAAEMADKFKKPESESLPPYPTASLCVRLYSDPKHHDLLSLSLHPPPAPELRASLSDALVVPRNMYGLSAEAFLMGGMRMHVASALFCLERHLVLGTGASTPLHLTTSEAVHIVRTERSIHIARADSGGLAQYQLEISFDSPLVDGVVRGLETLLQRSVKAQLGPHGFSLAIDDLKAVADAVSACLREMLAYEISEVASSFANIEVHRHVSVNWDRYIAFRRQQGNNVDALSISPNALFFQIVRNKESCGYLVVEIDREAEYESSTDVHYVENADDWIRVPAFSLLQLSSSAGAPSAVQFFQRFPAFRKDALAPMMPPPTKKQKTASSTPPLAPLFLHVVSLCHERIQLQHYVNFAKRRRVRIRYAGQGGTASAAHQSGEQIVSFPFPERVSSAPMEIRAVHGHLRKGGGFEMCVQLASPPFTFLIPNDFFGALHIGDHHALPNSNLIFRYPPTTKLQPDNPLETFIADLLMNVKPMCEFGVKLEKTLSSLGRYGPDVDVRDHFIVERADPFSIVLACRTSNPKRCVAAGSTPDDTITYRIMVQFKPKGGFILTSSHRGEHPLLQFIQAALNVHNDSAQLLEALERTTIPLAILSSVVSSQVISAKCYRHDSGPRREGGGSLGGKKGGGKGLRFGYKGKLPGEEKGYYAERTYGGDDRSFVPADLLLIPRSQNHIRLTYADRCGIDVFFMENETVTIKSAPCGARVPSCAVDGGLSVSHATFGERLRNLVFPEMASL
ncbi:hypothetical protein SPRG_02642 [Saprolegnia parasitica CBS 223.65]|uniref:Mediator of RNA polymerase II transcription subunit 14 n=1 Tax=Saprolegnia parasitica (strain CBS 223.65) TaxID=695850 RepID=A0A067CQG6_SAPPC|nr:hypothetical protein SPRG_02642 [Saprolegnia parasitica CBS 223.65]KDO32949.1 hypothetical protein SPRG_02642 [Saprolegnia parasitica CBS 223.65]|eukprot:XP_012196596.1 hypothetical protein SPRG_02642 [Saprolegnia parasitica CBS 223.65]